MIGQWYSDYFGLWFGGVALPVVEPALVCRPTVEFITDEFTIEPYTDEFTITQECLT